MLALVPFDWQVHDTHFVVAHMHYVLVGGMFFPLMAGSTTGCRTSPAGCHRNASAAGASGWCSSAST